MPASFRSASAAAGIAITFEVGRPPGVQVGDVMYAVHSMRDPFDGIAAPSGWTLVETIDDDFFHLLYTRVWKRTVTASTPTTFEFRQHPFTTGVVVIAAAYGISPTVSPRVEFAEGAEVDNVILTPSVQPATSSHLELRFGTASLDGATTLSPPATYTLRGQARYGTEIAGVVASRQINSSAPSGSKNFTASPAVVTVSHGITISLPSADTVPDVPPPPPFTPGRGSALYRYVFRRLLDRSYLGDLDLAGVTFDKRIGQAGSFSATIPIPSKKIANQVAEIIPRDETVLDRGPGVITCEVYRGGEPWGEYWITGATISRSQRGTPSISLRGSTVDAYLSQVEVQESLTEFVGEDQIEIARQLISHMQDQANADIGLALQSGTSGVPRDRLYLADEGTYGQHLLELAAMDGGFEWTINLIAGSGGLERKWVWGCPTLGETDPQHVFVDAPHGGDILGWTEEVDALRGGTRWRASGNSSSESDASTGSTTLYSAVHAATAHLAAGWPRLDKTVQYSDEDTGTLDDFAAYWLAKAPGALRVDQYTVALGARPSLTPNTLGDKARLYIENEWHLRHSRVRRIIGLGITPVSRENGKEEAQLVLEGRDDA